MDLMINVYSNRQSHADFSLHFSDTGIFSFWPDYRNYFNKKNGLI